MSGKSNAASGSRFKKHIAVILALVMAITGLPQLAPQEAYAADIDGISMTNWMQYMPDNAQVSQLNLVGTHDAGTYYCTRIARYWAQCQENDITKQLESGVRVLDIRCGLLTKNGTDGSFMVDDPGSLKTVGPERMGMNHNGITCWRSNDVFDFRILTLEYVMKDVDKFLQAHPSETVIIMVADEVSIWLPGTKSREQKMKQIIKNSFNEMKKTLKPGREIKSGEKWARFDFYSKDDEIPQLGKTRGRCIMYDDNGTYTSYETHYRGEEVSVESHERDLKHVNETAQTQVYGTTSAKFREQDFKNWEKEGEPDVKWVTSSMNNEWVGADIFQKIGSVIVQTPVVFAQFMNHIMRKMNIRQTSRFGWLMMDFPTERDVRHYVESNMGHTSLQCVFDFRDLLLNDPDAGITSDVIDRIYRYSDNYEKETIMLDSLPNKQVSNNIVDGVVIYNIRGLDMKDDKGADWHYSYGENPNGAYRITKAQKEPAINDYEHPTDDKGYWTSRQVFYKADMGQKDHLTDYECDIKWFGEDEESGTQFRPKNAKEFAQEYGGIVVEQTDPIAATTKIEITNTEKSDDKPYFTYPENGEGKIHVYNLEKYNDYNYKYSYAIGGVVDNKESNTYQASVGNSSLIGKYLRMSLAHAEYPYAKVDVEVNHTTNYCWMGASSAKFSYTLSLVGEDNSETIIAQKTDYFPSYTYDHDFEFENVRFDEPGDYTLRVRTTAKNYVDAWRHDTDSKDIHVRVTENEEGKLEADVVEKGDKKPSFWHEYGSVEITASVNHMLDGSNPNGDHFLYSLYKDSATTAPIGSAWVTDPGKYELELQGGYTTIFEPGVYSFEIHTRPEGGHWASDKDKVVFDAVVDFDNEGRLCLYGQEEPVKTYEANVDNGSYVCRLYNAGTFDFTHTNLDEKMDIDVTVEFEENEDVRPADFDGTVDIELEQINGAKEKVKTVVSESDSWKTTFKNQAKYYINDTTENSKYDYESVLYTINPERIENYDVAVRGDQYSGFVVTYVANKPSMETVDVKAKVVWDDGGKFTKRPAKVNTYVVTDDDMNNRTVYPAFAVKGWSVSCKNLSKYGFMPKATVKDIYEIKYSVVADKVEGYEGPVITGDVENGFTIKYKLKENKHKKDKKEKKHGVDTGDHNGLVPMLAIMFAAIIGLIGLLLGRKNRRQ